MKLLIMLIFNIKKGFNDYQILIENKNKYANQLIEEDKRNKEWKLYSNFLNLNLPPHKVGYIPRKRFKIWISLYSLQMYDNK